MFGNAEPGRRARIGGCADGAAVAGAIRAAFQMVEPEHGLQKRGQGVRSFPVQAIALGKQVTVLALSGEAALPEGVNPRGLIFAPFSIGIGAAVTRRPLPHHRACGSVHGGSRRLR